MLSSLSKRPGDSEQSSSLSFIWPINGNYPKELNNNKSGLANPFISKSRSTRTITHVLCICILLAGSHIQCSESKGLLSLGDEELNSAACVCEGVFFQTCPNRYGCSENKRPRASKTILTPDPFEFSHDDEHPDHVEDVTSEITDDFPNPEEDSFDSSDNPIEARGGRKRTKNKALDFVKDGMEEGRIVRERKVVVDSTLFDQEPIIHPISLTIPVRFKQGDDLDLPPPKPLFKMRKYVTYDTQPEIQMVPVTTTVIKPVGISKDQLVDGGKTSA